MSLNHLSSRAKDLGATQLKSSWRSGKKWAVLYKDKWIHFGAKGMSDFTIHKDLERRKLYRKRHGAILLNDGRKAYLVKTQPAYWSWHLLW
jgi:hypothetical protein